MAVDWDCVVEHNRAALKRILATMVAMVAAGAAAFTSPLRGGRPSSDGRVGVIAAPLPPPAPSGRPPHKGEVNPARPTLPRHLYRAVLAILHPAESAARRLIVVAARGLSLPPPRLRPSVPKPGRKPSPTAIVFPHGARFPPPPPRPAPARIPLPMFDTLRPPARRPRSVAASIAPRIAVPGLTVLHRLPPKPTPFDAIDATRLTLRLAALSAVLDDLPGEALRFARWRARRDARLSALLEARTQGADGYPARIYDRGPDRRPGTRPATPPIPRVGRLSPLRPGRPPGSRRRGRREVDEILANVQHFAWEVLQPDTS